MEQSPLPYCYEGVCSCPVSYRYDGTMQKCVPTGEGEYDTKGPSGTGDTEDEMQPPATTKGEICSVNLTQRAVSQCAVMSK